MLPSAVPWSIKPEGLVVTVRLTPRAACDRIDGVEYLSDGSPVLKARVRAVPEKGLANGALLKLLAVALRVPGSRVSLLTGDTARRKSILIAGDGAALAEALLLLLAANG